MCDKKNPLTYGDCIKNAVGSGAEKIAGGAADAFFGMIADGARDMLGTVSTFWMKVPSPVVASGPDGNANSGVSPTGGWGGAETITSIQGWIAPIGFVIFMVSLGMALLKIAYDTTKAGEGINAIVRSLVTTLAGGLPILAVTMLGIQFGDEFSPWILAKASGEDTSDGFATIFTTAMMGNATGTPAASGALLIIFLLAILGAITQCFFMVVRGAAIITLLAFAQVVAAGTATEEGWLRFKRVCMLLVGFVFYKPVAAVIYGVGLKLMSDGTSKSDELMNAIFGLTVLVMAALALPAFIKFVAPAAALGSSSAFSGGAAVAAVAGGAAVVALAGTGGGSAATSGAGGGATGASMNPGSGGSGRDGKSAGAGDSNLASRGDSDPAETGAKSGSSSANAGDDQKDSSTSSGAELADTGRHSSGAADSGGNATQAGAATVQNVTQQMNQAGEETSGDA